jgi:hypothetical protein
MAKVIAKTNVKREKGYLYFVDSNGDVSRTKMARGKGSKKSKIEKVAKAGVKKEKGFLYFVDKGGNIAQAKMARGRK